MKHETSSRASALLRKASPAFEPSAADRKNTRAAIRRRIAVGIAAGAAASATTKTAAAAPSIAPAAIAGGTTAAAGGASVGAAATAGAGVGLATKIAAAVAIFGTVSAGAVTVHRASVNRAVPQQQAQTVAPAHVETTKTDTATKIDLAQPIPIPEIPALVTTTVELSPSPVANRVPTSPSNVDSRASTPSLQIGAEVDLLRRAQEALHDGNADAALVLLDEHAKKFPNGALSEERDAARILALCDAHRVDDARASAKAFSSAHPASPSAARIASSCAGTGSTSQEP